MKRAGKYIFRLFSLLPFKQHASSLSPNTSAIFIQYLNTFHMTLSTSSFHLHSYFKALAIFCIPYTMSCLHGFFHVIGYIQIKRTNSESSFHLHAAFSNAFLLQSNANQSSAQTAYTLLKKRINGSPTKKAFTPIIFIFFHVNTKKDLDKL